MEKIIDREVAWRIFAHEFIRSNLYFSEGDERAPNYIITPTGVKCNRLFIVGVVTEAENIGHENELWKARIADPTGVFTVYAGQYQPEAAIFLSELDVPAFVALVGKARKYEPEDGNVYLSIRPEEINLADEKLRDRWVLDTAERTLERIRLVEGAQASGLPGNKLVELLQKKGTDEVFADGIVRALNHYANTEDIISELKTAIINAIQVVVPAAEGKDIKGTANLKAPGIDESTKKRTVEYVPVEPDDTELQIKSVDTEFVKDIKEKPEKKTKEVVEETKPGTSIPETDINQGKVSEKNIREKDQVADEIDEAVTDPEIEPQTEAFTTTVQEKPPEPKEEIAEILEKLDSGRGVPLSMIVESALSSGMSAKLVESGIKELMAEGRCYEPKIGLLRKV